MKKQSVKMAAVVVAFVSAISITACGGGGGSSSTPEVTPTTVPVVSPTATPVVSPTTVPSAVPTAEPTAVPTLPAGVVRGQYLDAAVEGLHYYTATQSGTTGKIGDYYFMKGETVQFYLYGTPLIATAASIILTPADANNVDADYSVNLLRLLQTLDVDADPSNGITLPKAEGADANTWFELEQDIYVFEKDATVRAFIDKYAKGRPLVGIKEAINHFNSTLENVTDEVVLDVTGKTLNFKVYDNRCMDGNDLGDNLVTWQISADGKMYTETGYSSMVMGTVNGLRSATCYTRYYPTPTSRDIMFDKITNNMNTMFGGPVFSYKKINRIGIRSAKVTPSNGLESIVLIWHTPGTKQITYQRRYIKTEGSTSTEPLSTLTWVYTWE